VERVCARRAVGPFTDSKFDCAHVAALGPRRSLERDVCFRAMGVVAKAAMWCAYL
jgi:hypothetical protein